MNDLNTEQVHTPNYGLDAPREKRRNRREEAQERKEQFYKELNAHRSENEPAETNIQTEEIPDAPREDKTHQTDTETLNESNVQDKPLDNEQDEDLELQNKLIPKKRFDKELEKRRVLEEQLQQEREQRIRYQTEMELYNKAIDQLNQSKQIEPELNVVDEDAHKFYMNKINELEKKFQSQNNNLSDYEKKQNFTNTVNYQASEITKKYPDFNQAYEFLISVEASKAKMMGYNDAQAQNFALESIKPLAWKAYEQGQNVAELTYNIAKSYGYKSHGSEDKLESRDLDKVSSNMKKSHSALQDVRGVNTSVSKENAAYNTLDGFSEKLSGPFGRGTDKKEFHKALEKLRAGKTSW